MQGLASIKNDKTGIVGGNNGGEIWFKSFALSGCKVELYPKDCNDTTVGDSRACMSTLKKCNVSVTRLTGRPKSN
jgi:hypothetical protein